MLTKEKKTSIIGAHKRSAEDTGSAEVQVALLSERISQLSHHLIMVRNRSPPKSSSASASGSWPM